MPPSSIMCTVQNVTITYWGVAQGFDRCRSLQPGNRYPANPTDIPSNMDHPTLIAIHRASFDLSGHNYFECIGHIQYVSDSCPIASIHDALVVVVQVNAIALTIFHTCICTKW